MRTLKFALHQVKMTTELFASVDGPANGSLAQTDSAFPRGRRVCRRGFGPPRFERGIGADLRRQARDDRR
jgi:hypothetical protein